MRIKTYVSDSLKHKLNSHKSYKSTIVSAPEGYGKTSVLKEYFKHTNENAFWMVGCMDKKDFFDNFKEVLLRASKNKIDIDIQYPEDIKDAYKIADWISSLEFPKNSVFILDDYDNIKTEKLRFVFEILMDKEDFQTKFIFVCSKKLPEYVDKKIKRDEVLLIGLDDLKLKTEDIIKLFHLNGFKISEHIAWQIYDCCDGWPIMVGMQLKQYALDEKIDVKDQMNTFLHDEIWMKMDRDDREFLTAISVPDKILFSQVQFLGKQYDQIVIENLEKSQFIKFDGADRQYKMNPVIKEYFRHMFQEYPQREKNFIYTNIAKTCEDVNDVFSAIKYYDLAGDYEDLYDVNVDLMHMYYYMVKGNKNVFLNAANHFVEIRGSKDYQFPIVLIVIMFLLNEIELAGRLMTLIEESLEKRDGLSDYDAERIKSEYNYVKGLVSPDINEGVKAFHNIDKAFYGKLQFVAGKVPLLLGSPSALMVFHKKPGAVDEEVEAYRNFALEYYQMTNGHGKGLDSLIKAELLFNRGDFEGAQMLCYKAMYVAKTRSQYSIFIAALLILARISIFEGDAVSLTERIGLIDSEYCGNFNQLNVYKQMAELCKSYIFVCLGDCERMPDCLKDEKRIEDETNFVTLAYANIVYGKYLMNSKQYHHFRGISGQMMGVSESFSYVYASIYTFIYMAISNYATEGCKQAGTYLEKAINFAYEDMLYIPFVENYCEIKPIINEMVLSPKYADFVKQIEKLSKVYDSGKKAIVRAQQAKDNYGLTARECDVAKLAAKRMSNKEIAELLMIAESTVKSNMKTIFAKLNINSRSQLAEIFK